MPLSPVPEARERGAVTMLVAISLLMLIGFVALVVDLGFRHAVKARLQTAADSAVLAAAEELPTFGATKARAVEYASLNYPTGGNIVTDSDVTLGHWDASAGTFSSGLTPFNAVHVIAQRSEANGNPVELIFARVLGVRFTDVASAAIATRSLGGGSRFLVDKEMFDTDIPAIQAEAAALGVTADELLADTDGDWFIDFYDLAGPIQIELPTGQVGDPGLFDIDHPAFPFSQSSSPSFEDFLNWNEDGSWREALVPAALLDPLLGVSAVEDPSLYSSYVDTAAVQVSPVYKSDISVLGPVSGVPAVNALGERRGLVAFRVIAVGSDPDGPGGSVLPNLIIELVDTGSVSLSTVTPGGPGKIELVG